MLKLKDKIISKFRGKDSIAIIAKGSLSSFSIKILGTGIGFVFQVTLAGLMGAEYYGDYMFVMSYVNILGIVSQMGWDSVILKYLSAYEAQKEWSKLKGLMIYSLVITIVQSLLITFVSIFIVFLMKEKIDSNLFYAFIFGFILIPFRVVNVIRLSSLTSFRRIILAQLPEFIIRPVLMGIILYGLSLSVNSLLSSSTVIKVEILVIIFTFILGTYWLNKYLPSPIKTFSPSYDYREWWSVALPLLFISGMNQILNNTDTLMIGVIVSTKEVGIYRAAAKISSLLSFALISVNAIMTPMIAGLYASQQHAELQKIVSFAARIIFIFCLPVMIILVIMGQFILSLFGAEFITGYSSLVILLLGQLVASLAGSVGFLMTMTGHQKQVSMVMTGSVILNVILNALLIPFWGINGAAIATSITMAAWNITLVIYVRKYVKINPLII